MPVDVVGSFFSFCRPAPLPSPSPGRGLGDAVRTVPPHMLCAAVDFVCRTAFCSYHRHVVVFVVVAVDLRVRFWIVSRRRGRRPRCLINIVVVVLAFFSLSPYRSSVQVLR